jgi:hypothetical protein
LCDTPANEWRSEERKPNLIGKDGEYFVRCEAHEEVVRRLQEKHKEELDQHSAHLVERIEGMKDTRTNLDDENWNNQNIGYNRGLDQAIDIVKDSSQP